ncbi:LysR family transcriptional regulator [Massilia endophytica]|uniref:LysR family transcriptional regulator n=1 Tax=Massilia endophytica TaxID=2899220 RepID=UPI001E624F73|nr:LysR family transcriptional regulator [Massilia endophytica]UGQ48559.1 LysR family transcriptional regulator [Massilia endophytica]
MDRLRALEVFVEVVRKDGFARAAEALGTSPANVTRYIGDLEAHLNTRLLNRSSRKMSLTPSGEALFERARSILEEVQETEALVSSAAVQPRGLLRINAPLSFGILHLAPLWPQFAARYPDVKLEVSLVDRVVDIVEEGFDMAVRIARSSPPGNVARTLATSRNVVCASPDYVARHGMPLEPGELQQHRCIVYANNSTSDEWPFIGRAGKPLLVKVPSAMQTNNGDTARAAALGGMGIICQPTFLVGQDLAAGRLVQVLPGWQTPSIDVQAVYPSRRHLNAKVRVMIDFLAEAFSGVPPWER